MDETTPRPITDEDRRLAESKKLTLDPIHARVVTDDVPDDQIATNHLVNPPIANAPNDTEQNSTPIRPTASAPAQARENSRPHHSIWHRSAPSLIILGIFVVGGLITGTVFFLIQ